MKILLALKQELKAIMTKKMLLVSVLAVALIPLMYISTFLWAFWDPYGKLHDMPVAVVNEDKGAVFNGKQVDVGKDFTDKIKETKDFNWQFVTKEEADRGLEQHKYYLAVEIPGDFSQNATKVLDANPVPSMIKFVSNESTNFASNQIGRNAIEKMKAEISHNLTKAYAQSVFDNIHTLSDGLAKAADGASQLSDGSKKVENGLAEVERNLGRLNAEGTMPLQSGIQSLQDGASKLAGGADQLRQGTSKLAGGLGQLAGAEKQLEAGQSQLQQGAQQLEQGTAKQQQGADQLHGGLTQLQQGTNGLQGGLSSSADSMTKLSQGAAGLSAGLQQLADSQPELAKSPEFQKLLAAGKQVAGGAAAAVQGQQQLADGAAKLAGSSAQLEAGAAQLEGGAAQLAAGSAKLSASQAQLGEGLTAFGGKLNEAAQAAQAVDAGAAGAAQGAGRLHSGLGPLGLGAAKLADSTAQLNDGTHKLAEGMGSVVSGSGELSGKLSEAAGKTSDINASDSNLEQFSNPVKVDEEKKTSVPNYGTGIAPYFMSLGLFVGALMLSVVFALKTPAAQPQSAFGWFVSKFAIVMAVATLQALLVDVILLDVIKIEVRSVPLFIFFTLLTSWAFMSIIQFLVSALADAGRFIAVMVLILQLTSSAGTFPLELIPAPLQTLNHFLPMSYSVTGFRAVISSGQYSFMWSSAAVLGSFLAIMSAVTFALLLIQFNRGKTKQKLVESEVA